MTRVTVDETLRTKLRNLSEPLELCDESGAVVAHVVPLAGLSDYERWEPPMPEEELRKREQSAKWYTTEDVLAHLRSLEKQ